MKTRSPHDVYMMAQHHVDELKFELRERLGFLNHLKTTIAWIKFDDDYLKVPGFYAVGHYVDERRR